MDLLSGTDIVVAFDGVIALDAAFIGLDGTLDSTGLVGSLFFGGELVAFETGALFPAGEFKTRVPVVGFGEPPVESNPRVIAPLAFNCGTAGGKDFVAGSTQSFEKTTFPFAFAVAPVPFATGGVRALEEFPFDVGGVTISSSSCS